MALVTSADLVLHPVRLRIIQAFVGDRKLTTADLRAELPDVPAASLYRHLARLIEAGLLDVVAERRVRGTVERTYVRSGTPRVSASGLATMTPEDHRRAFLGYVISLLADFDRYLDQSDVDLRRDSMAYYMTALWLDDEELLELVRDFDRLIKSRRSNLPRADRKRRILRTVLLPGTDSHDESEVNDVRVGQRDSRDAGAVRAGWGG